MNVLTDWLLDRLKKLEAKKKPKNSWKQLSEKCHFEWNNKLN